MREVGDMGETEVRIRRAKARDMAFIIEMWRLLSEERAKSDERYALRPDAEIIWAKWSGQRLRDQSSVILVAETDEDCVGYLVGYVDESQPIFKQRRHGYLSDVYVSPDHRRKGVAGDLIREAEDFFKSQDVAHVRLNVLAKNTTSRAFCEKLGFGDFLYRMWKPLK